LSEELKGVGSIIKIFKLLDCFSFEETELGVMDLSNMLDMPKATVSRLVNVLEKNGYLEQNRVTKKYKLGLKLFYLGSIVLRQMKIEDKALPIMEDFVEKTGESIYFNVIRNNERMCLIYLDGKHDLQTLVHVGQRSPLYAGASAKVLLAFMKDWEIDEVIRRIGLAKITPDTISDPDELKEELAKIREQGYALSMSERILGVTSISAPVKNYTGKVIGSLSVTIPVIRANKEKIDQIVKLIIEGAKKLSFRLGWDKQTKRMNGLKIGLFY